MDQSDGYIRLALCVAWLLAWAMGFIAARSQDLVPRTDVRAVFQMTYGQQQFIWKRLAIIEVVLISILLLVVPLAIAGTVICLRILAIGRATWLSISKDPEARTGDWASDPNRDPVFDWYNESCLGSLKGLLKKLPRT